MSKHHHRDRDGVPSPDDSPGRRRHDERPELYRAREALLAEAERIAHVGSYLWEDGKPPLWSDEFFRIMGYEPGEVEPGPEAFFRAVHPEDVERLTAEWARAFQGEIRHSDYRVVRSGTGEVRSVRAFGRVYGNAEGRVIGILGVIQDTTEATRNAIALEEALAAVRAAEQVARFGTFVVTTDPFEIRWSDGMRELTGLYDPNASAEERLALVHPEDRERQLAWWAELIANKSVPPIQVRMVRPDGELRYTYTHAALSAFLADRAPRIVGTTIDVTERVLLEDKLREASKMEAVGTLAAGVAHDFNNYLTAVGATLEFLRRAPAESSHAELLDQAALAVGRCTELTRELLAFARRQPFKPELLDMRDVIGPFSELLRQTLGRRADLSLKLPDRPLYANIDPRHLEQMLANLVVNARDAIEQNGEAAGHVRIVADSAETDGANRALLEDLGSRRCVRIGVEDDGCGIAPEHVSRIFDPYFTTKARGRGTGLGLASVYGMARQNGGLVTVEPLARGTRFLLWFPEAQVGHDASDQSGSRSERAIPSREDRRVLVVDDIAQVRSIAARALREGGFDVLEAATGAEALSMLDNEKAVHLVLTDVQMPQMNGRELARAVLRRSPGTRVALMTGYADVPFEEPDEAALPLLFKPFTTSELVEFVHSALVTRPPNG